MELQQHFKCKTCGQPLDEIAAASTNGLVECPSCYNVWTIPKHETSQAAVNFLHMGEHALDTCKFDDALTAFKKAAELDSSEPEAYFGMALATFKVQYLKDVSGDKPRLQPICHEISDKQFSDNADYMRTFMKATAAQRAEYEKKAQEIDYILKEFYNLKQSGLDYDCFICVKVTDGDDRTEDSKDADYIYRLLRDKGYKPFYSEYEIRNKQGVDYEARILYALYTSECMLVVCRNEEYLQTPWVKNEYTRFLKLVNDEEKESDSITIVFNERTIERLPGRAGKLQGIDFSRRSADSQIVDFVESHTPAARQRRAEAAATKLREQEVQANRIAEMAEQQRKLQEQLAKMQTLVAGDGQQTSRQENKCPICGGFRDEKIAVENGYATCVYCRNKFPLYGNIAEIERIRAERKEKEKAERKVNEDNERKARLKEEAKRRISEKEEQWRLEAEKSEAERTRLSREERNKKAELQAQERAKWGPFADNAKIKDGVLIKYTGKETEVVVPKGIIAIGNDAFRACNTLIKITIPEGVTAIGNNAFNSCYNLSAVILPSGLTSIGEYAFSHCYKLVNVNLPEGLSSIGERAFERCDGLSKIIIPESVIRVGEWIFGYCSRKMTVYCRHAKKPEEWHKKWNNIEGYIVLNYKHAKVVWGYKGN